ncbi:hypothetical protein MN202_05850 [Rheinheimera muenzenbergensis]|uniref:TRAP-type C4-dicarboxylate transport system, small permease component n=1 Tax=Rheinheimera muenzenbergensis TaxID=1193628 RepID=A0ABU8C4N0_9GAMM
MHIWHTDVIAKKLARDEIDQRQKTKYFIALFYLQVFGTVLPMFLLGLTFSISLFTFASYVTTLFIYHLGAVKVYRACAVHKKASVLDTLVVISLPICLKIQLGYWASFVLLNWPMQAMQVSVYSWVIYGFITLPIMVWLQFHLIKRAVDNNYV